MKRAWLLLLTLLISMTMSVTAFAGVWKTGEGVNQNRWWYDNEDGTYVQNSWQWLDGNQDGIAECYYFDGNGWMLSNTTTPDGYRVNENGAWISASGVETRAVQNTPASSETTAKGENVLIVYFTRTGTTEQAAQQIQQLTGGRLVELEAEAPYSGSYETTLDRAERELHSNARPALITRIEQMETYDTIFVGYPIWHGDAPMVIDTFLESYDFTGKTIVPFCTSGGSGIGTSMQTIRGLCPDSTVLQGRRIGNTSEIQTWLNQTGLNAIRYWEKKME